MTPEEISESEAPSAPEPKAAAPKAKRRGGVGKIVAIVFGALVIVVLALIAVPFLIPASKYQAEIERTASDALGREFKIAGPLRFSFWPALGVTAQDVTIANAPGGKAALFASIGQLDIGVKIAPLLHGDVEVEKLLVKTPQLFLEEDVRGKPNWIFEPKIPPAAQGAPQQASPLKKFGFARVDIEDGALSYLDRLGKTNAISALNVGTALPSLDEPARVAGDFVYNADKVDVKLILAKPRALVDATETPMTLGLQAPKLDLLIEGALNGKTYAITGKLDAKGDSLRTLSAWTGNPIGEGGGMGKFSVASTLAMEGQTIALKGATFTLDAAKGKGDVTILMDPTGKPPYASGAIVLDALDVNPYLGPPPSADGAAQTAQGVNVQAPWGNAPIDMSGLKAVNADLKVTTGRLLFQKMKLDSALMDIALKDGVMNAKLNKLTLYGGTGSGVLTLDGRGSGVAMVNQLSVRDVAAKEFLTDAIALNAISGSANVDMTIKGAGATQQVLMNNLSGNAKFAFENGAVSGFDLAAIAHDAKAALSATARGPNAKTTFSTMSASYALANGVGTTNDLKVANDIVDVTGKGTIDLARQQMGTKVTAQFLKTDLRGLAVPVDVIGPWAKLAFNVDYAGAAKSVLGAKVQTEINKVTGGKSAGDLLREKQNELLQGKPNEDGTKSPGLLDRLLKKN